MNTSPFLVRARALTGFAELVNELGGNVDGLLREVGLTREMLVRPEATISMSCAVTVTTPTSGVGITICFGPEDPCPQPDKTAKSGIKLRMNHLLSCIFNHFSCCWL